MVMKAMDRTSVLWALLIGGFALGLLVMNITINYSDAHRCNVAGKQYIGHGQCLDISKVEYCKNQNNELFVRPKTDFGFNIS